MAECVVCACGLAPIHSVWAECGLVCVSSPPSHAVEASPPTHGIQHRVSSNGTRDAYLACLEDVGHAVAVLRARRVRGAVEAPGGAATDHNVLQSHGHPRFYQWV